MMRSLIVISLCLFLSTFFIATTAQFCVLGGVVPDCADVSLGLEAVWDQSSCSWKCPTKCPNGDAFRDCSTSGCSPKCTAGTTCRNDRCVKGSTKCVSTCVPNPTAPPPPPTVAPTQCAFGTTIQELRTNPYFEISSPKVVHNVSSAATLLPSSQAQLLGGIDGFSTLTTLFAFVEDGKIYQENVYYIPTSEMYVLYTYSAGENNHGWINPASESYRAVRIGDESMYECRVQKNEPRTGETVRTISFVLNYKSPRLYTTDVDTIVALANAMWKVGDKAKIPRSDYIINKDKDFKRVDGRVNSRTGKWSITLGFRAIQHPDGDRRNEFIAQLKKTYKYELTGVTINAVDEQDDGIFLDDTEEVIEAKQFYQFQTCQDGRTITAEKQCEAVTFAAAAATSSSPSIPIVAIIAPILGGILLIAIIATAVIIRRRRADTVKTIENIARHTADIDMETNPAIAAAQVQVQVEGADRV